MNQENKYIPGIFNYCDSWCERCAFTQRCRSYDPLHPDAGNDQGALLEILHESLQEALSIIREHVEQQGIDWETFQEEAANSPGREFSLTEQQEQLLDLARQYNTLARQWLDENRDLLKSKGDDLNNQLQLGLPVLNQGVELADALEVVQWYLFFISTKLHRALRSLQDSLHDPEPIQNDANGSAKITLIAVENSLSAWEVVRQNFPGQTDQLLDLLVLLSRLRKGIERTFPHVHDFIRPGFDEVAAP